MSSATSSATSSGRDYGLLILRYKLAKFLSLIPNREKRVKSSFEDLNLRSRFYRDLWKGVAEKSGYHFESLGFNYWRIEDKRGRQVRGRLANIELDTEVVIRISGNKPLCHRLLKQVPNYRAPDYCEFNLNTFNLAIDFINKRNIPCVIKPATDTGAGTGVVTGINSTALLRKAAISASILCKDLLIEETILGNSYRLLYLNGEYIHGIQRNPPQVTGDGVSSIRSLIKAENNRRRDSTKILSLFAISLDQDCNAALKSQFLTLESVPQEGENIIVKHVINQNACEQNIDITHDVHPSIIETGANASLELGMILSGIDVLTTDIKRPLSETGGVINEVNGNPGLHHHYLTSDYDDPGIAEKIIKYCLGRSDRL